MAKTQEELKALKEEYKTMCNKLQELTEDELIEVCGGYDKQGADWNSELPRDAGSYKLDTDVKMDEKWSPPNNDLNVDNGVISGGIIDNNR